MREDHVPSIGPRIWLGVLAASVFGTNTGDLLSAHLALGFVGRLGVVVVAMAAIFAGERYDRSKTEAWYWAAAVVIQAAATRLCDFLTIDLRLGRIEIIVGASVLLALIVVTVRSGEKFVISTHMVTRPGRAARPIVDATHWMSMVVASTLGAVASDFLAIGLGIGMPGTLAILSVMVLVAFGLQRLPEVDVLLVYWLTGTLIRATGTTVGDLLAKAAGLPLSTLLTGAVLVALIVAWRRI